MSYHTQSAQPQPVLCRGLQFPCAGSCLPEYYGEDKNALSKPSTFPGLVMTRGMRSVPHLDVMNMGRFQREPQQRSTSHCPLEWCISFLSVAMMNIPRWRQPVELSIFISPCDSGGREPILGREGIVRYWV